MTLRLDRRPLYALAQDQVRSLIEEGELQAGDQLPSEARLASQLGISRATLREALRLLEEEGIIVRRQGVGTFVAADHHLESGLERLESILALAARQGLPAVAQDFTVETVEADRALAERLHVDPGTPLTRVRRTIVVENRPVAYMDDIVPARWLSPDDLDDAFTGSVLDQLRQRNDPRVQEALAAITAVSASRPLAEQLGVRPGTALLLLEETLFDGTGTPVGFSHNYFVPDRIRFHVVRR
jgi:GntR family transcriptional regulator